MNHWNVIPPDYNSKVTVELGEIVDNGVDIWDFEHTSFYENEADQKDFEQKFIDRYRFRQIGQETVGRFLHYFRSKVRELTPYYLDLYESVRLMHSVEDPFQAYDLTETLERKTTNTGSSSSESSDNGSSTTKFSDTPQNYVTEGQIGNYLTEVTENDGVNNSSASGSSSGTGTEEYTLTRKGNIGVQPLGQEIEAYRKAVINVDEKFFDEFNNLFLMVY